jgi:cysteinyl-tRNA synthetase
MVKNGKIYGNNILPREICGEKETTILSKAFSASVARFFMLQIITEAFLISLMMLLLQKKFKDLWARIQLLKFLFQMQVR